MRPCRVTPAARGLIAIDIFSGLLERDGSYGLSAPTWVFERMFDAISMSGLSLSDMVSACEIEGRTWIYHQDLTSFLAKADSSLKRVAANSAIEYVQV